MSVATIHRRFYNRRRYGGYRHEDRLGRVLSHRLDVRRRVGRICRRSGGSASQLHAGAARGHAAVHLFLADPSLVAAAPAESLWLLSWPLRLCRSLRPQLSGLLLLAGVDRLLSRGSRLLRRRRRSALRDLAVGFPVPLR